MNKTVLVEFHLSFSTDIYEKFIQFMLYKALKISKVTKFFKNKKTFSSRPLNKVSGTVYFILEGKTGFPSPPVNIVSSHCDVLF